MKPWWHITQMGQLREEFDENDNGGGGDLDLEDDQNDDLDDDHEDNPDSLDDDGEGTLSDRRVGPVVQPVDPKAIAEAVAAGLKDHLKPGNQPPQMSEEDFRKATDYFAVSKDHAQQFAALLGVTVDEDKADKLAQFLQGLVDGTTKHSLKVAGLMNSYLKDELSSRVVGLETAAQRERTDRFFGQVLKAYPALKQHRDILPDILNGLKAGGAQPKNQQEAVKMVAKAARDHVRKFIPNFMANGSGGSNPSARRSMAGSVTGNGASTGGFGAGSNKKGKAASLPWD